ncbi:MAG: hypothetical protein MUF13_08800, partial [Akkermansiaceae bacterium]|nr:hypothetical protein [Akkermansiaceae bacterium]
MKTLACLCFAVIFATKIMGQDVEALRKESEKLGERGLWRDAVTFYAEKLLPVSDAQSGEDLSRAVTALERLSAWQEFDGLVEKAVSTHPENPALLTAAAEAYREVPHQGRLIAGDFQRDGEYRYGGRSIAPDADPAASAGSSVETEYRDHVRSLQLLVQAISKSADAEQKAEIWATMAEVFAEEDDWKLQTLTPLAELPEWGEPGPDGETEGAPWAGEGPVLYEIPTSWEAAKNDGERWRFSLAERARLDPDAATEVALEYARFLESQFGTDTLSSFGWWRNQDPENAKGILEMDTLAEDECLAKTSDGVRRFKLPASQHFIAIYRSLLDQSEDAGDKLTDIFLNRRQYDKARTVLEQTIAKHGAGDNNSRKDLLRQITGNWGRFGDAETVPAGSKPMLPL